MTWEIIVIPLILGALGYAAYLLRDFVSCILFASINIEELGSFVDSTMLILKKSVWNKNWIVGRYSITKTSTDSVRLNRETDSLGLDSGWYIGRYKGKGILVVISDVQISGFGDWIPRHPSIKVFTMRWNSNILFQFMKEAKAAEKPIDNYTTGSKSEVIQGRNRCGFDGIFLPDNLKNELITMVTWFVSKAGEQWYNKMKQPYKLVLMFHGAPGMGKTAIARAIADVTQRSLTHVRLISNAERVDISHDTVANVASCRNDVILIDEIDKLFLKQNEKASAVDPATLLGLLNGDLLDGQIIVLTANDLTLIPEEFRGSLLRSRRVDQSYHFELPTDQQKIDACKYFNVDFNEEIQSKATMADVMDVIMNRLNGLKEITAGLS